MDTGGWIIVVVLGTEIFDLRRYERRTDDTKTKPKTGAGISHGKSPFMSL